MTANSLAELAKLALDATDRPSFGQALVETANLMRRQTGAVSALVFYGDGDRFTGCGSGDEATEYSQKALAYLQQRLLQLRVPLAFNIVEGQVRHLTRAANKQPRDHMAWLIPVTSSWTELLVLRGAWPSNAIQSLLDTVDSAMPALAIIVERFLGLGRRDRFERQLKAIESGIDALKQSASVIGTVNAMSGYQGLPPDQVSLLHFLAGTADASLEEARAGRDLLESHLRLQEYVSRLEHAVQVERKNATTDAVTGLLNGRGALELLQTCFEMATDGSSVSILLGDIDGFKLFNDTYGHVVGDQVLRQVANVFSKSCGQVGTASRYGGDEFLAILPGLDKPDATDLATEIARQLGRTEFRSASGAFIPISMSIGVATYPSDSTAVSSLIAVADSAMYAAKKEVKRENSSVVSSIPDTHFGVLEGLVMAVHAKDRYTKDHCDIVAEYAVKTADRLGLPEESKRALTIAGLLHDIGKLVIPDKILKKPSRLTDDEYEVMKQHVRVGETLIREVPQLKEVLQAVSCHHERYDGSGYPRGLHGDDIPLLGRVIGIADAYSAMRIDRPYRKAMTPDHVLTELVKGAGSQFDPEIVHVFGELMLEENVPSSTSAA